MDILISYRGIDQSHGWATGDLVANAFRQIGHNVSTYGFYYPNDWHDPLSDLNPQNIHQHDYDLVIFMECNDPAIQYLELKDINAKIKTYWNFDVSYNPDFTKAFCRHMSFDHIFYANPNYSDFFEQHAPCVSILPYALCKEKHSQFQGKRKYTSTDEFNKRPYKFAIIGSPWKERKEIVTALSDAGLDAHLITGVFREQYIETLANTQVSINYNVSAGKGLLVMRVWESLANHCCLVTNDGDHISRFLEVGEECIVYNDIPGLVELCKEIDGDPRIAHGIARNGAITGHKYHTYNSRVTEILETLNLDHE